MRTTTYQITCSKCKSDRTIVVCNTPMGQRIDWLESEDNKNHPICSARLRFDGQWGFQCLCGNNNLWTQQESQYVANKVAPTPQEIKEVIDNLKVVKDRNFSMEAV